MSFRTDILASLEAIRAIPEALGLRDVRVWVRDETSTQAFNTGGDVSVIDDEVSPRPKVVATKEQPGFPGGAIAPAYDGRAARRRFTVGPLTRSHSAGGFLLLDLFPVTTTAARRPLIVLADADGDGEIGETPVAFRVEAVRMTHFSLFLDVIEADAVT